MNCFYPMLKISCLVFRRTFRVFHCFLFSFVFVFFSYFYFSFFSFLFVFISFCFHFSRCIFTVCVIPANALRYFLPYSPSWHLTQSAFTKASLVPTVLPWRLQDLPLVVKTQTQPICWIELHSVEQLYDKYETLFELIKICWYITCGQEFDKF